jgi:hypothetical protein
MRRRAEFCVVSLVLLAFGLPLRAGDLTVTSQNTLHLGWGKTNQNNFSNQFKVDAIWEVMRTGHVGIMQEVMPNAPLGRFGPPSKCVGTCKLYPSGFFGPGQYKEAYVFIVVDASKSKPAVTLTPCSALAGAKCNTFSRPPVSLLFTPAGSTGVWVADFHAIWGDSKGDRKKEANNMLSVITGLRNKSAGSKVIVGGDWNLDAGEVKTEVGCGSGCTAVGPTDDTSLTRDGDRSSSYDHFIGTLTVKKQDVLDPPISNLIWRTKVSDHLPVLGTYTY